MTLLDELGANHAAFRTNWMAALDAAAKETDSFNDIFLASYNRLSSLQAWRGGVLEGALSQRSYLFFLEAQNDGLVSHIQASVGMWRGALQSLRSMIENTLYALYYKDHPVELTLWEAGSFRISVSELHKYLSQHPDIAAVPASINGLGLIQQEYRNLSKAVHASAREFRMTAEGKAIALWHSDRPHVSRWKTHEARTVQGINLLLIAMFKSHLTGTRLPNLRAVMAFAIPKGKDAALASRHSVKIKR